MTTNSSQRCGWIRNSLVIGLMLTFLSFLSYHGFAAIHPNGEPEAGLNIPSSSMAKILPSKTAQAPAPTLRSTFGNLPLQFEANHGQTDGQVKFLARGRGYTLFLTPTEAVMVLRGSKTQAGIPDPTKSVLPGSLSVIPGQVGIQDTSKRDSRHQPAGMTEGRATNKNTVRGEASVEKPVSPSVLRMSFAGANQTPAVTGQDKLPGIVNYFIGNDPDKWRTQIPTYKTVHYRNVYEGIDVAFYGNQGQLEYDLIVAPGADPNQIQLAFAGIDGLSVNGDGDLVLSLSGSSSLQETTSVIPAVPGRNPSSGPSTLRLLKPHVYQLVDGKKIEVAANYLLKASSSSSSLQETTFVTPAPPSVIPEKAGIQEASKIDSGQQRAGMTTVDDARMTNGRAAVIPAEGGIQVSVKEETSFQNVGIHLAAYDRTQPLIIDPVLSFATYLDASVFETGRDIAVDKGGNAYVTGKTFSPDFPTTTGAFDEVCGNDGSCDTIPVFGGIAGDGYVAKINPHGTGLVYATYFGGSTVEEVLEIALDDAGNVFVGGRTESADFPVTGSAFDITCGTDSLCNSIAGVPTPDAFLMKLNSLGDALVYSTFLGGSASESIVGIAVDPGGSAYVAGSTSSGDFPTTAGVFDTICGTDALCNGSTDGFITKFGPTGNNVIYSTFLGGSLGDSATGIKFDGSGNAYLTGSTWSNDFPTTGGAFDTICGASGTCTTFSDSDAFVTKLSSDGSALVYSTFLGGDGQDSGSQISIDSQGNAFVIGRTFSDNFPVTGGVVDSTCGTDGLCNGTSDAYVTKLDTTGSNLIYSTFLGGSDAETGRLNLALDASGNAFLTGETLSPNFPTTTDGFDLTCGSDGSCNSSRDGFLTKLSQDGSQWLYSTFIGGTTSDGANGVALSRAGSVYVIGETNSTDFPVTSGAFDTDCGIDGICNSGVGSSAFVVKIVNSGSVTTWGSNGSGTLASGAAVAIGGSRNFAGPAYVSTFPTLELFEDIVAIETGSAHGIAIDAQGSVWTWGDNSRGQLGDGGVLPFSEDPFSVPLPLPALAISAGFGHNLVLLQDGTVMAWGENINGQVGVPGPTDQLTPIAIPGLTNVVAVSAGGSDHSLALLDDGTVRSWGSNIHGELGIGAIGGGGSTIQTVTGLTGVVAVSAGGLHSLALLQDGTVMAWGRNNESQLGYDTTPNTESPTPALVQESGAGPLTDVVGISGGIWHSLALLSDGTVQAWGTNLNGALGNGSSGGAVLFADPVLDSTGLAPLTNVQQISAGLNFSMAILNTGEIVSWGSHGVGQLGSGEPNGTHSSLPVLVRIFPDPQAAPVTSAVYISAGSGFGMAVTSIGVPPLTNFPPMADDQVVPGFLEDPGSPVAITLTGSDAETAPANLTFLITAQPSNGILTGTPPNVFYDPNDDYNGPDSFTFAVQDDDTTTPLTSPDATVTLSITAVNDAPEFTGGGNVQVAENAGPTTVAGWATNIQPGPATATDEAGQILTFMVTGNTNPALFSTQPSVDPGTGDLTFESAVNANGVATINLVLMDDGGTANGGQDATTAEVFTIDVQDNVPPPPNELTLVINGGAIDPETWKPEPGTVLTIRGVVLRDGIPLSAGEQPNITFSLLEPVTTEPGAYTNDPDQGNVNPDFSFATADLANGDRDLVVTAEDYGGRIKLHAVTDSFDDGTGNSIVRMVDLTLPRDEDNNGDGDGIADQWEEEHGGTALYDGTAGDPGPTGGPAGDGLSAKQKYRGFKWGVPLERVTTVGNGETYQTVAWVPDPTAVLTGGMYDPPHVRGNPTRKDLFIAVQNYDFGNLHDALCTYNGGANCEAPFAVGDAFDAVGIDVHVRSLDVLSPNPIGDAEIHVITMVNVEWFNNVVGQANRLLQDGPTNPAGDRNWSFDRKGESCIGSESNYQDCPGNYTETYQIPQDHYFDDAPFGNGVTFIGDPLNPTAILPPTDPPQPPHLDPRTQVLTPPSGSTVNTDDDPFVNAGCSPNGAENLGDYWAIDGGAPCYGKDLSSEDIDNDGRVEFGNGVREANGMQNIPDVPTHADVNLFESTRGQVLKRTITHELGHAVGIDHDLDPAPECLMRGSSESWHNDDAFCSNAVNNIDIHNE